MGEPTGIKSNSSIKNLMTAMLSPRHSETPSAASLRTGTGGADSALLKRIPTGTEATNVLVGSVDFLDKPIMAFVRLRESTLISYLMEVPLPVRFIFILMGPQSCNLDYHEIGRSISTLMADQVSVKHIFLPFVLVVFIYSIYKI